MKKITLIFTALAFVAGTSLNSCTKENTTENQTITTATDAVLVDYSVSDIGATIDQYEAVNSGVFVDPTLPTLKASNANSTTIGTAVDKCATVTLVKTPTITGTAVTGATVVFTIDFGATGCVGSDGKARRGTITSTYTWVKEGGWSRVSAVDLYVSDVHHVGTQTLTFGVTGANKHAYITEKTTMTVTGKDGTVKSWVSERQRELMEGNGGVAPVKIWKITGNAKFTNAKGEQSTYTITSPLYTASNCKGFVAGTVVTVSTAGVSTTIEYGTYTTPGAVICKDGFTIKGSGDKNGKGAFSRFIKFAK